MKRILEILQDSSQTTPEQISVMLDIPVNEVKRAIKQAEQEKIILKYKTIINWAKAGRNEALALIEVKVVPQRNVGFDSIADRIYQFPQVYSAYLVSGTYDLALLVKGENMQEIASFVSEKLAPMEQVQSTVTHFLLKRYKEDGEILHPTKNISRLSITP
ncbi:MAG: Lrp/AsnC family transcriptional regulator [Dehalococcoidia bacterium]|nr:Lrp/AsnC family transcriptional regulator [Dehalococcoidia bacterium]